MLPPSQSDYVRVICPPAAATLGTEYQPPAHTVRAYEAARAPLVHVGPHGHRHDVYTFGPDVDIEFAEFEDVVGRHFRQPPEGLGFDNSPVAHMGRTMIRPHTFLWRGREPPCGAT